MGSHSHQLNHIANIQSIPTYDLWSGKAAFSPPFKNDLVAWWKFGVGLSLDGFQVNSWADQLNGQLLFPPSDPEKPIVNPFGSPFLAFDGTTALITDAFAYSAPCTRYVRLSYPNPGDTGLHYIIDGVVPNSGGVYVEDASGFPVLNAGAVGPVGFDIGGGFWNTLGIVMDGDNSLLAQNEFLGDPANPGPNNPFGVTLASQGGGGGQYAAVNIAEILLYGSAHNAAQIAAVSAYMQTINPT